MKLSRFVMLSTALFATSTMAAELHLYSGAGLKDAVEPIVKKFEQDTGNTVNVEYGGSGQILARFKATNQGDLFLSGAGSYVDNLPKGAVAQREALVLHIPVMAVRKDKAEGIHSLEDLANSNLRIGIGDPKAMALGKGAEAMFAASGVGDKLEQKVVVRAGTVKQLMLYLLNGDVDAAVVGRAGAFKAKQKLDIIPTPKGIGEEQVTLAELATSKHLKEAKALFEAFTSKAGRGEFEAKGFLPLEGK